MGDAAALLPLLAIAVLFWFLVIRPASRRQKEMARIQSELALGQRVMLSSGIFGTVQSLTDDRVRVEIADGVVIEVVRAAISGHDQAASPGTDVSSEGA